MALVPVAAMAAIVAEVVAVVVVVAKDIPRYTSGPLSQDLLYNRNHLRSSWKFIAPLSPFQVDLNIIISSTPQWGVIKTQPTYIVIST